MRRKITTSGNSAALILSRDLLDLMGVSPGDEVEISVVDRTLIVRSIAEAERSAKVQAAMDEVFRRRDAGLLRRLAGGVAAWDTLVF